MFVEIESTPNPDTLKFLPGKKVSEVGPIEFLKNKKNIKVSLAKKILSLQGTVMVFFGEDFITVKKERDLKWEDLKRSIILEINEHYSKGNNVVIGKDFDKLESESVESNETIKKINEILDSKIRPAVAKDGGDIAFKSFKNGVVTVELKGSCSGCPSSTMTLKQGVQNLLSLCTRSKKRRGKLKNVAKNRKAF